jgi:(p)ppGpp synthase/HD superfamily hydrolase
VNDLERAIAIAAKAHEGVTDRANAPYILHPLRVMLRLTDPDQRIAAVLHDVVEDNAAWPLERLRGEGFSEAVLSAVDALTKRDGEEYEAFVRRAAAHPLAARVKLADLDDNLDRTRFEGRTLTEEDFARFERYERAKKVVEAAIASRRER